MACIYYYYAIARNVNSLYKFLTILHAVARNSIMKITRQWKRQFALGTQNYL